MNLEETDVSAIAPTEHGATRGHPLKIAYIFMRYPSGVQPFAISDIKALEKLGHHVHAYALSGWDPRHTALLRDYDISLQTGSHISWRTATSLLDPQNWGLLFALFAFLLRRRGEWRTFAKATLLAPRIIEVAALLERSRPDVVHAFWGHVPSLVLPLVARRVPGTVRSIFLGAYDLTSQLNAHAIAVAKQCDTVWTHSEANRPTLLALGISPAKLHVAHRGIPIDLAVQALPEKSPLAICTAANLQREKNVDLILRAFERLARSFPGATLTIAGDGGERAALERLSNDLGIADHVHFTGLLPRKDLFREMARARVFLFLSTKVSERLPNVVKEAMLAGCHCVVSRTEGIDELVADGETGTILESIDPDSVADLLAEILRQPECGVGQRASALIRTRFSSEATMRPYAETWRYARAAMTG